MKHLKKVGFATLSALIVAACVGATSASATTICVGGGVTAPCTDGHPGGAVTLASTNSSLAVSGGGTVSCNTSTISGTAPSTTATWLSFPVTLSYSGCTAFFFPASVTVPANCSATGANPIRLDAMYNQAAAPQGVGLVTIPAGCDITVEIPSIGCDLTVAGPQTIGNGGTGTGGISWTNGNSSTRSSASLNSATLPTIESNGVGFGCPSAGAHSGTLTGTYSVTSPATAPGATLIP
jgi:hypothetical protein